MRMIQAECSILYNGRGHTELGRGIRTILIKDDNTVIIHRKNGVKPTNYMGAVINIHTHDANNAKYLTVFSKKEMLSICIFTMIQDISFDELPDDADMEREGTERQQQEWLSRNFSTFGDSMTFLQREFQTGDGAVDLLGMDIVTNAAVFVEVKRNAVKHDVYQIIRYRDAISSSNPDIYGDYPIDANMKPVFILASENDDERMVEECSKHDIIHINTGSLWRKESVDSITARRVR
jgi:RecB family endonuclease NucS